MIKIAKKAYAQNSQLNIALCSKSPVKHRNAQNNQLNIAMLKIAS